MLKAYNKTRWGLGLACMSLGFSGCSEETDPAQYLQNLRIIAAEVTPLELGPQTPVELRAFVHIPEGDTLIEESWSFCPVSLGAFGNFECIAPSCEFCVYHAGEAESGTEDICAPDTCDANCSEQVDEEGATGNCDAAQDTAWRPTLSIQPADYFLSCFSDLGGSSSAATSGLTDSDSIPESIEILFRYTARTDSGEKRQALVRVPFWTSESPEAINQPPQAAKVSVNGSELSCGDVLPAVEEGEELIFKIEVEESSLDLIANADQDGERKEDIFASYFTTAGRFDKSVTDGLVMESSWEARRLEEGQNEAAIHIVLRDERGGQQVLGPYRVPIKGQ